MQQSSGQPASAPPAPESANDRDTSTGDILDRISDGLLAVDRDWRITYLNAGWANLLSVSPADCLQRPLEDCFPTILGIPCHDRFHEAAREGKTLKFESYSSVCQCWLELAAYPSPSGLTVLIRDISGKKTVEEELLAANERFRLAARTEAIYDWDIPANHLFWGEGLEELFGYRPEELQRIEQWKAGLIPERSEPLMDDLYRALADPAASTWEKEYRIRHKNGSLCVASEQGHIIRDGTGRAVRMVGIMKNVTEQKILEIQLERERKKATAAIITAQEEERSQIGRELHDNVNQVLTSAKLYAGLARDGRADGRQMLDKAIFLVQDAIDEIRTLSRRLSGDIVIDIDLADAIRELMENVGPANKLAISFHSDLSARKGGKAEIKLTVYRILQEHLTNIVKHAKATVVTINLSGDRNSLTLKVTDNGVGFDTARESPGLGLANMRSRVESLMGSLQIDSGPGKGTTLLVQIPLVEGEGGLTRK